MNEKLEKFLEEKVNKACFDILEVAQGVIDDGLCRLGTDHLSVWIRDYETVEVLHSFLRPRVEARVIPALNNILEIDNVRIETDSDTEYGEQRARIVVPMTIT